MNHALYATRLQDENRTESTRIILDAQGNVTNPLNQWGHAWHPSAIHYAQDQRSFAVYSEMMDVLNSVIGEERDTATVNAYNQARGKFQSVAHAESMLEKLQLAAKGGSEAALIVCAAACTKINKLAFVDFSWYFASQEEATPAPVSPVVAHDSQEPTPEALTLTDPQGRTLTATATGWQAESSSQPGDVHKVSLSGSSCTCHGFAFHGKCWHTSLIRSLHAQPTNKEESAAEKRRKERERALPISRRRRGKSRMWK